MVGTETGIVALISTMERHSARSPTANAVSIRLLNPGGSSQVQPNRREQRGPWLPSTNIWCVAMKNSHYFLGGRSKGPRRNLVTLKETRPGFVRMVGNIRT